jgi:hypothetical protein
MLLHRRHMDIRNRHSRCCLCDGLRLRCIGRLAAGGHSRRRGRGRARSSRTRSGGSRGTRSGHAIRAVRRMSIRVRCRRRRLFDRRCACRRRRGVSRPLNGLRGGLRATHRRRHGGRHGEGGNRVAERARSQMPVRSCALLSSRVRVVWLCLASGLAEQEARRGAARHRCHRHNHTAPPAAAAAAGRQDTTRTRRGRQARRGTTDVGASSGDLRLPSACRAALSESQVAHFERPAGASERAEGGESREDSGC